MSQSSVGVNGRGASSSGAEGNRCRARALRHNRQCVRAGGYDEALGLAGPRAAHGDAVEQQCEARAAECPHHHAAGDDLARTRAQQHRTGRGGLDRIFTGRIVEREQGPGQSRAAAPLGEGGRVDRKDACRLAGAAARAAAQGLPLLRRQEGRNRLQGTQDLATVHFRDRQGDPAADIGHLREAPADPGRGDQEGSPDRLPPLRPEPHVSGVNHG